MGWFSKAPVQEKSFEEQMAEEAMSVIDEQVVLAMFGLQPGDLQEVSFAEQQMAHSAAKILEEITPKLRRARNPEQREEVIVEGLKKLAEIIMEKVGNIGERRLRFFGCAAHRLIYAGAAKV